MPKGCILASKARELSWFLEHLDSRHWSQTKSTEGNSNVIREREREREKERERV